MELDHLILCAETLEDAARSVEDLLGAGSVQGGSHTGLGTHNCIVPLGSRYLELLAVENHEEAHDNGFGRWAMTNLADPLSVDAVCLRTDDLDSVCDRLDLEPVAMSRIRPDGVELRWRLAGMDRALANGIPFFIQWEVSQSEMPGSAGVDHPGGPVALRSLTVSGDLGTLRRWVGEVPDVVLVDGEPGYEASFSTPRGMVSL